MTQPTAPNDAVGCVSISGAEVAEFAVAAATLAARLASGDPHMGCTRCCGQRVWCDCPARYPVKPALPGEGSGGTKPLAATDGGGSNAPVPAGSAAGAPWLPPVWSTHRA